MAIRATYAHSLVYAASGWVVADAIAGVNPTGGALIGVGLYFSKKIIYWLQGQAGYPLNRSSSTALAVSTFVLTFLGSCALLYFAAHHAGFAMTFQAIVLIYWVGHFAKLGVEDIWHSIHGSGPSRHVLRLTPSALTSPPYSQLPCVEVSGHEFGMSFFINYYLQ